MMAKKVPRGRRCNTCRRAGVTGVEATASQDGAAHGSEVSRRDVVEIAQRGFPGRGVWRIYMDTVVPLITADGRHNRPPRRDDSGKSTQTVLDVLVDGETPLPRHLRGFQISIYDSDVVAVEAD